MFYKISSAALCGIDAHVIDVESDVSNGLPSFDLVGLLTTEVREARERVRVAIHNTGIILKPKRITVNLSPADIRKDGTCFDLPIAISLLIAYGLIDVTKESISEFIKETMFVGELSLDGEINHVNGILPITSAARAAGFKNILVPYRNSCEASCIMGINTYGAKNLHDVILFLEGNENLKMVNESAGELLKAGKEYCDDFSNISGQKSAKRAIEVAVAGMHNILLSGSPGSGKTMMAKSIPSIMPELDFEESLEISKIYSVIGGLSQSEPLIVKRPFRSPHHTITSTALSGGGSTPKPGEISLATDGVLFLDELPEFSRDAIEALRTPLEEKKVVINRLNGSFTYPADFMLVAAMNPCPCGNYPDKKLCRCSQKEIKNYQSRISRPILDRIDICVQVSNPKFDELQECEKNESSAEIKKRVNLSREIQRKRYENEKIKYNSELTPVLLNKYCRLGKEETGIVKDAFQKLGLSARSYHRLLKVARTIADLAGDEKIKAEYLCEAISYRNRISFD